MHFAVVGSQTFARPDEVRAMVDLIADLFPEAFIVSGGASGPDTWAVDQAKTRGLRYVEIEADWARFKLSAGMIRNREIIAQADYVIAFWDGSSPGTANSIGHARRLKKPLLIIT